VEVGSRGQNAVPKKVLTSNFIFALSSSFDPTIDLSIGLKILNFSMRKISWRGRPFNDGR
jgi:hypothetical protein